MSVPSSVRPGADTRVSWEQALAWRMRRHHLVERASSSDFLGVVRDICGLHAQLMSSAELSLWARVEGLEPDAVQEALWKRRTLVKLWAMRGTLHLLPSAELGLWLSALGAYTNRGMTGHPEIDALSEAVGRALEGRFLTREELAQAVEQITGEPSLREHVRFSWGSYLKPASFRGRLCFAPNDGGRVRFTTPATWIRGTIDELDREDALREVTRRFLGAYAPLTAEELAVWSGFGRARAKRVLAALGEEAVEIELEGDRAFVLARDVREIAASEPPDAARLLPAFDPWVVGASRSVSALLDPRRRSRVYRPQGWMSPVLVVNGRTVGVWKHERKGRRLLVDLQPFKRLPTWAREQIETETERLAEFLGCELSTTWKPAPSA